MVIFGCFSILKVKGGYLFPDEDFDYDGIHSEVVSGLKARCNVRKQVLVVDDDAGLQNLLQVILELEGYDVTVAKNGLVALEKLKFQRPDLILLDILMPGMDGFTFVKELEQRGLRPGIPILILTADARAGEQIQRMGFEGYLTKPFELRRFVAEVTKLLSPLHAN